MDFDDLSPELKAKALSCKTADELVALAEAEGIELTEEQLDAVSGGSDWDPRCKENTCKSLSTGDLC